MLSDIFQMLNRPHTKLASASFVFFDERHTRVVLALKAKIHTGGSKLTFFNDTANTARRFVCILAPASVTLSPCLQMQPAYTAIYTAYRY